MNNIGRHLLNVSIGYGAQSTAPIIPDELTDQIVKLALAVVTAVVSNLLLRLFKKKDKSE